MSVNIMENAMNYLRILYELYESSVLFAVIWSHGLSDL